MKNDDLKVAQRYNPNISDDSDHEDEVKKAKVKRQYRKRAEKQKEGDIKSAMKKTNKNPPSPAKVRMTPGSTNQSPVFRSPDLY